MRKLIFLILTAFLFSQTGWAATIEAPDDFDMTLGTQGNTQIDVSFTCPAECDTIMICLQADSTLVFYMNASDYAYHEAVDTTIAGLAPFTLNSWVARFDSAGTKSVSNGDSVTTARVDYETNFGRNPDLALAKVMYRAGSNHAAGKDTTTIVLIGSQDEDSTIVYEGGYDNYNITVVASGGDSTAATVLIKAGYTAKGESYHEVQTVDSLSITDNGVYHFSTFLTGIDMPLCSHFYAYMISHVGNEKAGSSTPSTFKLWLNRKRE